MVDRKVVWTWIGLLRYFTTRQRVHCEDRRDDFVELRFPIGTHSPHHLDTAYSYTFRQPTALNYVM